MDRHLILGTAGHIDHGKTSLVRALTGVDCDRLPEEKNRKITIDIGFATLKIDDIRIGVVDVPGHERFIKNMLAGATGVDLAILVIAADDSVMPQTMEHLEILQLLGLKHGLIALAKCDLVDATTLEVVELEIRELVKDTFLADAPIIPTSVMSGKGLDELKSAIAKVAEKIQVAPTQEWFRMPIDRSFVVQGHGTVVTGSVNSGSINVGDELEWHPRGEKVRVRSLQNHDQSVEMVSHGQRAAINLAGVKHEDVVRGQELATPGYLQPSRVLTVRLHCLRNQKRIIKHRAPLRLHIGTSDIMGLVSLLDGETVQPGEWGLAQLFLEEPATSVWGQPFVLRDSSATFTLGGGQILQPVAKKIRRRHLESLERLESLWSSDDAIKAKTVAWFAGFSGITLPDLVRGTNLAPEQAEQMLAQLVSSGEIADIVLGTGRHVFLHAHIVQELENRLLQALQRLHEEFPLMAAHDRQKVQSQLDYIGDDALVHAVVTHMIKAKKLVGDLRRIADAEYKPKLSTSQRKLKNKMIESYKGADYQPPEPTEFANQPGSTPETLRDLYEVCIAEGYLVKIAEGIYLHVDAEAKMRDLVTQELQNKPGLTVADIRDLLGTTRKFAVPFCEYLDSIGLTTRDGDLRVLATMTENPV